MKTTTLMMTLGMVAASVFQAPAKDAGPDTPEVHVYYTYAMSAAPEGVILLAAQKTANGLLADAGIRLKWRYGRPPAGESGAATIAIAFIPMAPHTARFGVLAAAWPYARVHTIEVFWDRTGEYIRPFGRPDRGKVLGHVLAHEIVHVLEGIARHSDSGLMKAHWTKRDLFEMTDAGVRMAKENRLFLEDKFKTGSAEVEQAPREGGAVLSETCGDDAEVRQQVVALLEQVTVLPRSTLP